MHKITFYCLIILVIFDKTYSNVDLTIEKPEPTPFQDWDYLVYSQRWPITTCLDWEERNKNNKCNLPIDSDIWTVHGIWPTKIGKNGPFFCDSALHFDMSQIEPILNDLELYWTNIEGNTKLNSFWKHEWDKHGTCASILPQLDSVTNFFDRGLLWNQKYKLTDILSKNRIVPNSSNAASYTVEEIFDGVRAVVGKNPNIQCVVDGKTKRSLISEIRICFNKDLDLIDCNVTNADVNLFNDKDGILTNCKLNVPIMYYSTVPSHYKGPEFFDFIDYDSSSEADSREECLENYRYEEYLLNFYNSLKFLIWFTL